MSQGLVDPPLPGQGYGQVEVHVDKVWLEPEGLGIVGRGLVEPTLPGQHAPRLLRLGMAGVKPQALDKLGHGLVEPTLLGQGHSQVVMHIGIIGVKPQGLGKPGHGLVETTLPGQGQSHVIVCLGVVGVDDQASVKQAMASSSRPWRIKTDPRLLCTSARSGSSCRRRANWTMASWFRP